jgi:hypothetical protein
MSEDQIREILIPATEVLFWREYKDDDAREMHWREIERGFVDRAYLSDRLHAKDTADIFAKQRRERMTPFWLAWYYLRENLPAAIVNLPTPDTDSEKIDPDAAARAARETLAIFYSQTAATYPDDVWITFEEASELTNLTASELSKLCNSGKVRSQGKHKGRKLHCGDVARCKTERSKRGE